MAVLWRFQCYVSKRGIDEVRSECERLGKKVEARLLSRLQTLASLPAAEWHHKYIKKLSGECEGLWEIRFEVMRVQHRPLGFRSGDDEFTILFWAQEKNDRFVPPKACERALGRKAEVLEDGNRTVPLWLVLE